MPFLLLFPVLLTDCTTSSHYPNICWANRISIHQPAKQSSACKSWRDGHRWSHMPMSAWKVRQLWPWYLFLHHPQHSALRTKRPGATLEWGTAPRTWVELSLYRGWRLTHSPGYLPMFSAQAVPYAKLKILLCLIVCLLLGAGTLGRFLKSNYAYYWLGFQKPSLFAECINFQPSPSLILPDSPILQVDNCADGEQWRKAVTKNQRWKKWDLKMEREIPDDILGVHGVPKPSPWMSQLCEPYIPSLALNSLRWFSFTCNQKASDYYASCMWCLF